MKRPFRRILSLLLIALLVYGVYQCGGLSANGAVDAKREGVSWSPGEALAEKTDASAFDALSAAISPDEATKAAPTAAPAPTYAPLSRGAKGPEVEALQSRLNELGYSAGKVDGQFGGRTESAVRAFQAAAGFSETGIADDATLALLYSARALAFMCDATPEPDAASEQSNAPMVWIPRTGKRYHSNKRCSNMKNPSYVTLTEAERRGFTPCKKCY